MIELLSPVAACEQLGHRIRALRLARNVSQRELAGMTGSSLSSIRRLEASGQGSLELLVRVAQSLHAAAQLDALFIQPQDSIARLEAQTQGRQRARRAAVPAGQGG